MPIGFLFAALLGVGVLIGIACALVLRTGGASPGVARRLAGPPEVTVGRLLDGDELPNRPVRVVGRIRCTDPLDAGDGERLVAFHRDVEVSEGGGRWRSIERMRETRSFDLWDHDGSIRIDPALAAEPLITIPKVWRGTPDELQEPHASAVARLAERGTAPTEARAITRSINVTDRLLVLALPLQDPDGRVRLEPPTGGFLMSTLPLEDAMRLLGGRHRRRVAAAVVGLGLAVAMVAIGAIGLALTALIGA